MAVIYCVAKFLMSSSYNPFVKTYNISGQILNYKDLDENKPTDVEVEIIEGNPLHWEEYYKHYIYKIDSNGFFKVENIKGRNVNLHFSSKNYIYIFGGIENTPIFLKVDLDKLKMEINKKI